jgi:hypothetical protein
MPDFPAILRRRWVLASALAAVLAAGAAVRLSPWHWVFGGDEVHVVGDGDVLYHLMQAERLLAAGADAAWTDPGLNHPFGADVPWPPLLDGILAGAGWAAAGGSVPDRPTLVAAAVWVPAVLGVLMVLLAAWLGRALLGGGPWLDAALVLALLPAHAELACLGRADHHALEPVLLGLAVLAAAWLARGGGRGAAALLALAAALSFWNWNGSSLYLALLGGFVALWHVAAGAGEEGPARTAAWMAGGLLGGALLLAASVALLGRDGALGSAGLSGLTGLQPALVAGAALACAALAAARRWRPAAGLAERAATAVVALLLPAALLALWPWTRDGIGRGVTMLAARGWYRSIAEFRPLLPSGGRPLEEDLAFLLRFHGLTPLAALAALPLAWRRWRSAAAPDRGPALLLLALSSGALLLGWARLRFGVYLSVAEALSTAFLARELAALVSARWPAARPAGPLAGAALAALLVAPVLPSLPGGDWVPRTSTRYSEVAPLGRLAGEIPTPQGRDGVLAPWSYGHDLRWFSGRPVVTSPFGVEGGAGALEAGAAFHRTLDQGEAESLLAGRGVGLVVIHWPLDEIVSLAAFAPPDAVPVFQAGADPERLDKLRALPPFTALVAVRLWLWDGQWGLLDGRPVPGGRPALDAFRLVGESQSTAVWGTVGVPMFKLFQPVAGARVTVRGAAPGATVTALTWLVTPTGRRAEWSTAALAGPDGVARLRLPYATGRNGAVGASPWRLGDGRSSSGLAIPERAVLLGEPLEASLGR